jgi:hypothetical protein
LRYFDSELVVELLEPPSIEDAFIVAPGGKSFAFAIAGLFCQETSFLSLSDELEVAVLVLDQSRWQGRNLRGQKRSGPGFLGAFDPLVALDIGGSVVPRRRATVESGEMVITCAGSVSHEIESSRNNPEHRLRDEVLKN